MTRPWNIKIIIIINNKDPCVIIQFRKSILDLHSFYTDEKQYR